MDLTPLKRTSLMYSPVKNLTLVKANCSPFPVVGSGGGRHKIIVQEPVVCRCGISAVIGCCRKVQIERRCGFVSSLVRIVFVVSYYKSVRHLGQESAVGPAFPVGVAFALVYLVTGKEAEGQVCFFLFIIQED